MPRIKWGAEQLQKINHYADFAKKLLSIFPIKND